MAHTSQAVGNLARWTDDNDRETEGEMNNPEIPDNSEPKQIPCEVYSRIVGYLRPVQDWGPGKQIEFEDRKTYDIREVKS
jgi:hypothetical protein